MVYHPLILIPKLIVLVLIIVLLIILHGILTPEQFDVAVAVAAIGFIAFVIVLWTAAIRAGRNPNSWFGRLLMLPKPPPDDTAPDAPDALLAPGSKGRAVSALRPSGTALIEGQRVSVITNGEFIQAGTVIEVMEAKGQKVVVREDK